MLKFLMLTALAACGASDDPHEVITCHDYDYLPFPTSKCEAACTPPLGSDDLTGPSCSAINPHTDVQYGCAATAEVDGIRGCCADGTDGIVRFYECY